MNQQEQAVDTGQYIGGSTNLNSANQTINSGQLVENGQFELLSPSAETCGAKNSDESLKKVDSAQRIKRPMNPFMVFGCEKRKKLAQVHPRMHNSEISKVLGTEWKRMSECEKAPYLQEAKRLKEKHNIDYPNYKFKANRRKPYQAVKKEQPSFPYAGDINASPVAMKFPYHSPFFQDSMYVYTYPAMANSHPAYSTMYRDITSATDRQRTTAGIVARGATQTPETTETATTGYYSLNKSGSISTANEYYPSMSTAGSIVRGATQSPETTETASTGYYSLNKGGSTSTANEYYVSMPNAGSVARGATQSPETTETATTGYYALNKGGSISTANEYYVSMPTAGSVARGATQSPETTETTNTGYYLLNKGGSTSTANEYYVSMPTSGSVARGATQSPETTETETTGYYSLNKSGSTSTANDYYVSMSTAGSVARGATQSPETTETETTGYYALNKSGSTSTANDYYASMSMKNEYYSQIHSATVTGSSTERLSTGEVVNSPD